MFSECKVYLEDYLLNDCNENYSFKAMIVDTLSYDVSAKYSYLQAQGYFQDTPGFLDAAGNASFATRRDLFKNSEKDAYVLDPVSFVGKLHTDLRSTECGIIPGISLRIELTLAKPDLLLLVPDENDTENYTLKIHNATLLCSVGTLTEENFSKLSRSLDHTPASIYYRKVQVTHKAIPANSKTFVSENLFSSTQLPTRLILGFVTTTAFLGDRTKNPFNFARKWTYESTTESNETPRKQSLLRWLPVDLGQKLKEGDKVVFLEKISLTLNGKSLDGWESTATEHRDVMSFMRLNHYLGLTKTTTGNNLTMDEFMIGGCFFCVYDLSTSGQSAIDYIIPSVRLGNLRLKIEFSSTTVEEISLVLYAEFPSLVQIDKFRRIKMSFL